jgi:myo-inositol catabolism protein IolC
MLGYDKQLFILPFDHRSSFIKNLLGLKPPLDKNQSEKVSDLKKIVFDGFFKVWRKDPKKEELGILIDHEFGGEIIKTAKNQGIIFANSAEKSGQDIFTFEYGSKFGAYLLKTRPTMAKVLVRYHPRNRKGNKIQLARLRELSAFCEKNKIKFLFELLVPAEKEDLKKTKGDLEIFDKKIRPNLTAQAILEIQKAGIKPDIWKLEAFGEAADWKKIIFVVKRKPQYKNVGIIVLGRGENGEKVDEWLSLAARFPEVIGFAVGRTVFYPPLIKFIKKKINRKKAIELIAKNFSRLIKNWRNIKQHYV